MIFIAIILGIGLLQLIMWIGRNTTHPTVNNPYGLGVGMFELTPQQIESLNNLKGDE